ncbi:uncharacterized protein LOC118513144 isoform X1 [Anopheles stephensi]|uniref:uncharacterized protein LOC118513144 isoform X1 n=1 Tax=Anopheles stephensi TaxID=30069 RepID=UPI0016587D2B|nr:uncharacterized protein LOC118513144 isoform X1 [Anopheles stephensi]XP_035914464.1 uncharacterized protein LOC118513144 isoform X1 [Anopheles stephensi]XP_035914465.1 uncharacterized protein LOC118513144 isoform X1 [Anopheles stephensi]XP_035914466.1 uncharacterized protein LOC118513144 isoform X1 [Anopheles stephensi]XP_035914467.1 uncharacterized protein LOC118513144 isoform X1 [Anopheles stephensi]XP_035914468.1 uncharacterized protein LOC118513144 isoform X1 [Anopheles stephensi]XP_03
MSMQALNGQPPQRRSSLLSRYQPKAGSQDPLTSPAMDTPPNIVKSTSQRSLQNSSLLQRYTPKPLGSHGASGSTRPESGSFYEPPKKSSSQRSLDQSKLLRRYYHQPNSLDDQPQDFETSSQTGGLSAQHEPQRYSSQKSLENSKLLQRYNPINNSQEFTGLSGRESTPVAKFSRGASLEPERVQRSSLLSKYTPRFGKSLDRNQALEVGRGPGRYSSQQNLRSPPAPAAQRPVSMSQSLASSQSEFADYGTDHFDQYQNIRSRSSSLSRGGPRRGLQRGSQRMLSTESEPDPITPETLPMVTAVTEPVVGNIASALPLPMVGIIPPTPASAEVGKQPNFETQQLQVPSGRADNLLSPTVTPSVGASTSASQQPSPTPPVKPVRKDLQQMAAAAAVLPPANIVSIAIPTITKTLAAPSVKQSVSSSKEPSPPLFSTRDRMDHYGSASNPDPPSHDHARSPPTKTPTNSWTQSPKGTLTLAKTATLQLPLSDMSSRRSMTDLQHLGGRGSTGNLSNELEISEFTDRAEMKQLAAQHHHPVKHTLASAFEQVAALTIPQAMKTDAELDEDERIEAIPPDRKLKKRDFTYHPSFVRKQQQQQQMSTIPIPTIDSRLSTGSVGSKSKQQEAEEKRLKAAEEKRKREDERRLKEEEKRRKDAEKRAHDDAEKRRKGEEKHLRDEEERRRREEERKHKEEEKHFREEEDRRRKEEERKHKEEEKRAREDEKRRLEEEKRKDKEEKKRLKDEKKKTAAALKAGASGAAGATTNEESKYPEEETIDLASHLDHYSVAASKQMPPPSQRSLSLGRPRSGGTPYGSQGALGYSARGLSNSHQSLDRNGSTSSVPRQSKLLQRYGPKAGSQEVISTGASEPSREFHRSQGSLDYRKSMRPSLLDKYTPRPLSASTAPGSAAGAPGQPRSISQRSLEAGGSRFESSTLLQRYKTKGEASRTAPGYDQYDHRDHEYEPIGEPADASKPITKDGLLAVSSKAQQQPDGQDRKHSNASFLRVPGNDEGDTISMEELQKSIEDRYFNLPTDATAAQEGAEGTAAASVASEPQSEKTSKMKAAMAKAQTSGKQAMAKAQESGKQAMARAQEGGKTLQKKFIQQTDRFKNKMSNIKLKKDKDAAPLASPEIVTTPELEKLDFTLAVPKDEEPSTPEAVAEGSSVPTEEASGDAAEDEATPAKSGNKFGNKLKNMHMPKLQKPDFKRPEFTKISKPKMPKLKTPDMPKFKRPEMPKFLTEKPDFSKMKSDFAKIKLARSKSMKEPSPSGATSAASPSDASIMGDSVTAPTKVNYTDFSTYPRIFDKFKRQKSVPSGQASVRAGTPPPLEFTKAAKTTRPKGASLVSRWTSEKSEDTESNRFLQYTGSELDERETSVERRMRQELERAEFEGPELAVTEEQKQLEEYDKENREIHLLSAARHEEFLKRKPPMERQESDLASEEEKQFWASSLGQKIRQNIDMNSNDLDFLDEEERLLVAKEDEAIDQEAREQARYLLELSKQRTEKELERRSSTPYTNQECQSSGSSSVRRRKGVLEEIDDDEFFLRQKGISKDNIQMGEYISSAIKEGLSQPKNALADMDRYDYYDEELDREQDGMRRYYQPSFESDDVSNQQNSYTDEYRGGKASDFYRTFPPDRPTRKPKKGNDQTVPQDDQDYGLEDEEEEEDLGYYDRQRTKYGSEQPQLLQSAAARYMDEEDDLAAMGGSLPRQAMLAGTVVPPTPPTRHRKKRFRDVTPSDVGPSSFTNGGFAAGKSISNNFISGPPPTTTMAYRAEVPLAREESFGTIPEPIPRRTRSRSQISKALDDDDRVSRGAESLIGGIIDRSPIPGRDSYSYEISESNGYATVRKEAPPRPPAPIRRRKSTRSLDAPPPRQFNTLPNYHHSVSPVRPQRNYSTINPNRPPRRKSVTSLTGEQQLKSSSLSKDDVAQYEDVIAPAPPLGPKPPLSSGDVASKMKDRPLPPPPRPTRKPRRPDGSDHQDLDGGAERMVLPMHDTSIEEVETATQTDPVSEDFGLDAEIAAVTERAARAHDGDQLEGALNRFREGNAKALSERPKSSRSGSRPETPASILIERKVSTPSLNHESIVEASLTVQPLEEFDDDQYIAELVKKYVSEERKPEPRKTDTFERRFRKSTNSLTREDEIRPVEASNTLRTPTMRSSRTSVDGRLSATTPEPLRNVEIAPNVIEEIVERLRTTEQQHIDELHKLHQQQLEDLRRQHDEQKRLQEQKLEEQQRQLLEQQNQQLLQTQQLKEQILQQQEHQKMLLTQQQNQQQQLLVAQQQQQLLMEQQEKERELQREKERELLKEREQELERARERERELHLARELELQRAREIEQQRARDLEQQRIREMELQRARELEHQRLRELEIQRAIEAEQARQREVELQQQQQQQQKAAAVQAAPKEPKEEGVPQQEVATKVEEPLTTASPTASAPVPASVDVVDGAAALPTPSTLPSDQPPTRPPLPPMAAPFVYHPDYLSYHGVAPSSSSAAAAAAAASYLMRGVPSDEDLGMTPLAPQRRRRHHRSKRDSTSEEDFQREHRRHRHGTRSPEPPSIPTLGGQLVRACGSSIRQTGDDLMAMLRASSKDENKRDLHIAIIILIVIVAGLMALGMSGEKAVHHHHWDYFSPPGHGSSA